VAGGGGGDVTSSFSGFSAFSDFWPSFLVPKDLKRPMNFDSLGGSGEPVDSVGKVGTMGTDVSSPFGNGVPEK
jgi:hypothetical protein